MTGFWARPATPQLGVLVGGGISLDDLTFGVSIGWIGQLCCERRTSGLRGDATELLFLLEGSWAFVAWGPVVGRIRAAGGLDWIRIDAQPVSFRGPALPQHVSAVEGVVRGGLAVEMELVRDRVGFELGAGAWVRVAPVEVALPRDYEGESWFSGVVGPYLDARVEVRLF